MARSKIAKRGPRTVATLGLEGSVAETKRSLRNIQQIINQAKRDSVERTGGELMGKMPPMFISVPTSVIGGAESYFQEISSATPKAFNNIFGKNKGARQIQVEAFKTFEMSRDSETQEQLDYITIASSVLSVVAYNVCQMVSDISKAETAQLIKIAVSLFQTSFASGKTIIESLDAVIGASVPGTGYNWTSEMGSKPTRGALVYPLNEKFLAARDKAVTKKGISLENKAKFLQSASALSAYRRHSLVKAPAESVALPKQITDAGSAADLVTWFKQSHQYSLEDTFNYYRDAVNTTDAAKSTRNISQIQKGLKLLNRAFDGFTDALRNSMYDDSASEATSLKREFFEILTDNASADDFLLAELALLQATSTQTLPLTSGNVDAATIEALGFNHFSSLNLIDLLVEKDQAKVSAADYDVWSSWQKIFDLLSELRNQALSLSDQRKIEDALSDALTQVSSAPDEFLSNVSSDFEKFANESLEKSAAGIAESFNTGFDPELTSSLKNKGATVGKQLVNVLNAMFKLYADDDIFTVDIAGSGIFSLNYKGTKLNDVAITSLAEGEGLDFYNEEADEFISKEAEIALEQLRFQFQSSGLPGALYNEVEAFLIDSAIELQVVFDALLLEAERDPDMAIFKNEGTLGMWTQIGIGAGALVGTHAVTALAQRFVNPEGITEGWKYNTAEFLPATLVGAVGGGYYWHMEDRKDIAIPMIGGAIGSVLLRVLTRKFVHSDNIVSKTLLKYLGAKPAEFLGDNTFKSAAQQIEEAVQSANDLLQINAQKTPQQIVAEVVAQQPPAQQEPVINPDLIAAVTGGAQPTQGYIDDQGYNIPDEPQMYAAPAGLSGVYLDDYGQHVDDEPRYQASSGLGGVYLDDAGQHVADEPRYQASSGLGRYMSTPMYDPFYSYNPPTEVSYEQAQDFLNHGGQLAGLSDGDYVDQEEISEIITTAQPLSKQEIMSEGLHGYVDEMIIRATPKSAQKLQAASAATMVGQSNLVPNSVLMQIGTNGQEGGIVPEYNPSLPSGVFAPQPINPVNHPDVVTSGLFSRGAFASRLPTAEDGFDY